MRKLLWVLVVLSVLWSGYWFIGASALRSGVTQWFAEQAARGVTAEHTALSVSGFPNRFDVTVDEPAFLDPQTGFGWEAPFLQVFAMTWKPWHVIAALPPTQTLRTPDQDVGITSERLRASARTRPSADMPLQEAVIEATAFAATSTQGSSAALDSMVVAVRATESDANSYEVGLNATGLAPDPRFIAALPSDAALPPVVDLVRGTIIARLSAPLDRHAAEARPRLIGLDVTETRVTWGDLSILARGAIQPDADGFAAGQIDIEVRNWQHLAAVLVAAGAVQPEVAPTVENLLGAMAEAGGQPDLLQLPLSLAAGRMSLGPLPLGPAPLLVAPTN